MARRIEMARETDRFAATPAEDFASVSAIAVVVAFQIDYLNPNAN